MLRPMPRCLAVAVLAACSVVLASVPSAAAPPRWPSVNGPVDPYAPYEGQTGCNTVPAPGTVALQKLVIDAYPQTRHRGHTTRSCEVSGVSEHKEGRAWDWPVDAFDPAEKAMADEFLTWLTEPDETGAAAGRARRLGIMYIIFNGYVWKSYGSAPGWQPYAGSNPHTDHVHFSLSWSGARQTTTWGLRNGGPVPGTVQDGAGDLLLTRGRDGSISERSWRPGTAPTRAVALGGVLVGGPSAARLANGNVVVAARGRDDAVWINWRPPGGTWQGWFCAGGVVSARPTIAANPAGGLDLAVRGGDGRLWTSTFLADGAQQPWQATGSPVTLDGSAPGTAFTPGGRLDQVVLGTDGFPWRRTRTGTTWSTWKKMTDGSFQGDVSVVGSSEGLVFAMRGHDEQGYTRTIGATDTGWRSLGGVMASSLGASATLASPRVDITVWGTDWQVWRTTGSRTTWAPWEATGAG